MKDKIILSLCIASVLTACGSKSQAEKFKEAIDKERNSYPIRLNETVTIDSMAYNKTTNTLSYYYSVTGELDNQAFMDKNYASYKTALQEAIDNSVEMEEYRKFGTTIRYIYFSGSNQKELAEFTFKKPN